MVYSEIKHPVPEGTFHSPKFLYSSYPLSRFFMYGFHASASASCWFCILRRLDSSRILSSESPVPIQERHHPLHLATGSRRGWPAWHRQTEGTTKVKNIDFIGKIQFEPNLNQLEPEKRPNGFPSVWSFFYTFALNRGTRKLTLFVFIWLI